MLRILPALLLAFPSVANAQGTVSACFSPGPRSCADVIADTIDAAHASIRLHGYCTD